MGTLGIRYDIKYKYNELCYKIRNSKIQKDFKRIMMDMKENNKFYEETETWNNILSEDLKIYLKKINKQFTDFEKATLIYNSHKPIIEIQSALERIMKETKDRLLAQQIKQRLTYEQAAYEAFATYSEYAIYRLKVYEKSDEKYEVNGFFVTLKAATAFASRYEKEYIVEKIRVLNENEEVNEEFEYVKNLLGKAYYNSVGQLICCYSQEIDSKEYLDEYDYARFEYTYVFLPHPFRTGQIVRVIGTDALGVVEEPLTDEKMFEYERRRKESGFGDHTDIVIGVEFLCDDGDFVCDSVDIMSLEYANLQDSHPAKELLDAAGKMLRGENSIQYFLRVQKEYQKHNGK